MGDNYGNRRIGHYRALGFPVLGLLGFAAFAFSPLVSANEVRVRVDPTSYFRVTSETIASPVGSSVRDVATYNPNVTKIPSGGLSQSLGASVEINAIKKSKPISARVVAGGAAVKNAAKSVLTRGNVVFIGASVGLNALLDSVDWVMGEGGQIGYTDPALPADVFQGVPPGYQTMSQPETRVNFEGCASVPSSWTCVASARLSSTRVSYTQCITSQGGYSLTGYDGNACYHGGSGYNKPAAPVPVSNAQIDDAVDNHYDPDPTDWQSLAPDIDLSAPDVNIELDSEPIRFDFPSSTTTTSNAAGEPVEVSETNIWENFAPVPSTNPSKQPELSSERVEETTSYDSQGNKTGSSSTTVSSGAASAGSSSSESGDLELPSFCDWAGIVCDWIGWTKEEPPEPPAEEYSGLLQTIDVEMQDYQITGVAGVCPAPYTLDLGIYGSHEISYQPFCDLAESIRALYLSLMALVASVIIWRSMI